MAWRIEYDAGAEKDLSKLDKPIAQRILRFLGERVANWTTRAASAQRSRVPDWANSGNIASAITASSPRYKTRSCAYT